MINALSDLSLYIRRLSLRRTAPVPEVFARRFNVASGAVTDGRHERPNSDATTPAPIEEAVHSTCKDALNRIAAVGRACITNVDNYLKRLRIDEEQQDVDDALRNAEHERKVLWETAHQELALLKAGVYNAEEQLATFRVTHQLHRPAIYPQSRGLLFGFLGLIFVIETIINASLLAQVDVQGFTGGFLKSAAISLVNFAVGCATGLMMRNLHHCRPWRKAAGVIGMISGLVALLFVNAFAGHYRLLLETADSGAQLAVWQSLSTDPMAVADLASAFYLTLLGISCGLYVCLKFWRIIDDRYPGHGAVDRAYRNAVNTVEDRVGKLRRDLVASERAWHARIVTEQRELDVAITKGIRRINHALQVVALCSDVGKGWIDASDHAIRVYRGTNTAHRSTPVPDYFSVYPVYAFEAPEGSSLLRTRYLRLNQRLQERTELARVSLALLQRDTELTVSRIPELIRGISDLEVSNDAHYDQTTRRSPALTVSTEEHR